ncbi:MAG: UDP-N-acetylmuramate--L-alanine ligase [Calditrichaeota bacterium]|nr:UDP-N-acetylmuramate--L-alanine ligase [Calditrichota bacterium]
MRRRFGRIHFTGIGGSGMSGIAEVLLANDFRVTGSDLVESETTLRLRELGAEIQIGHSARHVADADAVVYSSAVQSDNDELVAARQRKIPVIARAEMLGELMRMKTGIAISGTHGKTTVTSLTGEVISAGGLDPLVIIGGRLKRSNAGVVQGSSEILIVEADEFDRSFLRLTPTYVVITNIDRDHLECYGSFEELENAFLQFSNAVPFYGRAAICIDEPSVIRIAGRINRPLVTYGFSPQADVRAENLERGGWKSHFDLTAHGRPLGRVELSLPGRHNVLNALAAIAIGLEAGVGFDDIKSALAGFQGVRRRFEFVGEKGGVMVIDDFAHHPAEIAATLEAARSGWGRRIVAIFQPHLYSRTKALATEFGQALLGAETAIVLPIYGSREAPEPGVGSQLIVEAARTMGHKRAILLDDRNQTAEAVKSALEPGDMVIILGAGDVYRLAPEILAALPG